MKRLKNTRGITLIALVVTIVVLLILATVSISMLTGENGIISQAQKSKEATEQAKVQEMVDLAINTLISENMGSTNGITPKDIADKINTEYSQYENVYAEDESNFPTKIIFPEEGDREVDVDLKISAKNIYNTDVSEADIAPVDIFNYEIISDADTGAISFDSLPTKEARITGMNPKYCNKGGYQTETGEKIESTNYEIVLEDGTKITDTLIVPYEVEINGEMYKITEACLYAQDNSERKNYVGVSLPQVKKIVYPNTIRKIEGVNNGGYGSQPLNSVVNSSSLEIIGAYTFSGCEELTSVEIPQSVTTIERDAFAFCDSLTSIVIPGNVTNIDDRAFFGCSSLTEIKVDKNNKIYDSRNECNAIIEKNTNLLLLGCINTLIPDDVITIGENAFNWCINLEMIRIPKSITNIEYFAFFYCGKLTTVNYTGTMEQWQQISINKSDGGNDNLTNATIICTDGTINP